MPYWMILVTGVFCKERDNGDAIALVCKMMNGWDAKAPRRSSVLRSQETCASD